MTDPSLTDEDFNALTELSHADSVTTRATSGFSSGAPRVVSVLDTTAFSTAKLDQRLPFLKQYGGGSLAYSSLQTELDYYLQSNCGYIAYSLIGKHADVPVCLADPICSEDDTEQLVKNFIQLFEYPIFVHISKRVAEILSQMDFLVNEIGTETILDLQQFTLVGVKKEFLRSQINRSKKDGLVIKEQLISEVGVNVLKEISTHWLEKKVVRSRELSFLVRPIIYADEMDVRTFIAYKNECVVGFGIFDPIYRNGQVIGYLANTLRSAGCSYSIADCIVLEAMRVFKEEGREILSLGFVPLSKVNDIGEFRYNKVLKKIFQFVYEYANYVYEFKALAFHKSRYRPGTDGCREIKVYCAYKEPARLSLLTEVFSLMGINVISQMFNRLIGR